MSGTTDATAGDVVIGLGVTDASKTKATLARLQPSCFVADDECSPDVKELEFCAGWTPGAASLLDKLQKVEWLVGQTNGLLAYEHVNEYTAACGFVTEVMKIFVQ